MEGNFTGKNVYREHFVSKDYLKTYYSFSNDNSAENDVLTFALQKLHKAFTLDGIKGDTLIDIGSGPTIYQFLSACESFREIFATDYTDQNREELERWLKKDPEAFDWSRIVKYVCELEGDRVKWVEKEEKVRSTIKQVLKCDVTQANPLAPLVVPQVNCALSTLCLEAACKDLTMYHSALKNVGSLVKPGGHLILMVALEGSFYKVGQHPFSCLYLEQENVDNAIKEAGFDILWSELSGLHYSLTTTDNKNVYFLVGHKRSEG
ncbi:nicotinamide N-methyltransferase-like [Rhineura floridana]|uniref:nicotinamide N-methyltransferase-like n=1 Tax=Rhineura floridana TaxID=261503 RepID=UPI002AC889C4|nr:nicotinamide N-methyltransferase-like [Rhineura floridana]